MKQVLWFATVSTILYRLACDWAQLSFAHFISHAPVDETEPYTKPDRSGETSVGGPYKLRDQKKKKPT